MAAWTMQQATIPAGQVLSNAVDITTAGTLEGLDVPEGWRDAAVGIVVSYDAGVTWNDLFAAGSVEYLLPTVSPGSVVNVLGAQIVHHCQFKLRSGAYNIPVVQPVAMTFNCWIYG